MGRIVLEFRDSYFYPRPPRGGRPMDVCPVLCNGDFYPRPPRGGRPVSMTMEATKAIFLSTPSARRATWCELVFPAKT